MITSPDRTWYGSLLSRVPRVGRVDVFCASALVAVALKVVWGIGQVRDLGLADETLYLASGVRMFTPGFPNTASGLPPAEWGPLYSFWYLFLRTFIRDNVSLYFANWSILVVLTSLALYTLQRTLGAAPLVALLGGLLLVTSKFFDVWPYPMHFAIVLILFGLVLVARARTGADALRRGALLLLACSYVRPEFCLAFLLAFVALVAVWVRSVHRGASTWGRAAITLGSVAIPLAALLFVFGNPFLGDRAFYAWAQHYALNAVTRDKLSIDPWLNSYSFVQHDFGNVTTLQQAIRANPRAFAQHLLTNAVTLPTKLPETLEPDWGLPVPEAQRLARTIAALGAPFFLMGAVGFVHLLRAGEPALRGRARRVAALCAMLTASTLASALIVHPRLHYLLPLTVLTLVMSGVGLSHAARQWLRPRASRSPLSRGVAWALPLVAFGAIVLAPNRAFGWCPQARLFPRGPATVPDIRKVVHALRDLHIHQHVVVLEQDYSYAFYAGLDFERTHEWLKDRGFDDYVRQHDVNVVVVTRRMLQNPVFADDPQYREFLVHPDHLGFRMIPVPASDAQIAVRGDLPVGR